MVNIYLTFINIHNFITLNENMADTLSQLAEINALLASTPDDPTLLALKDDLLQLIALEEGAGEEPPVAEEEPAGGFIFCRR